MKISSETLERQTSADTDLIDLTEAVERIVDRSGVSEGTVTVFVPGSTASVTTIEFEEGALSDLREAIERIAPRHMNYQHDARWGDGNGYSHVRAALLGPSLTVPIQGGQPKLGTWQQVIVCDFDNRPRNRRIIVQAMGV